MGDAPCVAENQTASDLAALSSEWGLASSRRKRRSTTAKADPTRINLVSSKLCSDIIDYIGPSLERHAGCDLVEINPGVGTWSRALRETLRPRTHVMLEPEDAVYRPFLEPLLADEDVKTTLIAEPGIVWEEQERALGMIEHRGKPGDSGRNDTLVVTANFGYYPKKAYRGFTSVANLLLYQLLHSARSKTMFQRYGMVRMLIWVNDEETRLLLPRTVQARRKLAVEGELFAEWIHAVASSETALDVSATHARMRDEWIDVESTMGALSRMREDGRRAPAGRSTALSQRVALEYPDLDARLAGVRRPTLEAKLDQRMADMEAAAPKGASKPDLKLQRLRSTIASVKRESEMILGVLKEEQAIRELVREGGRDAEVQARTEVLDRSARPARSLTTLSTVRDNLHVFRQDPPVMHWDRRRYEPLTTRPEEFFPNVPCTLLDIQPRTDVNPLLREIGPRSTRAGDIFDLLIRGAFNASGSPVVGMLERLWPGASTDLPPECPSFFDVDNGGGLGTGLSALVVSQMNERQWMELLDAWMRWPFKPTYTQLVARHATDVEEPDDKDKRM